MQANVKRTAARMRQAGIERPNRPRTRQFDFINDILGGAADITRDAVILGVVALFVLGSIAVT